MKLKPLGRNVVFTHGDNWPILRRFMKAKLGARFSECFRVFDDNDLALEWCENELIESVLPRRSRDRPISPDRYELLAGFSAAEIQAMVRLFQRRGYVKGESIVTAS